MFHHWTEGKVHKARLFEWKNGKSYQNIAATAAADTGVEVLLTFFHIYLICLMHSDRPP